MKNMLIAGFVLAGLLGGIFTACKNDNKNATSTSSADANAMYACPMHPDVTGKAGDKCSKCGMALTEVKNAPAPTTAPANNAQSGGTTSIKPLVDGYLLLKNAFTSDKTQEAAAVGKALEASFKDFDKSALTPEQKKVYDDIADDAREHAEHIGANGGNIEHQREHFALLSKDVYDLVKAFGSAGQPLYQDFCPMYDKKKGAIWLSETKDIANPYYGKKMYTCGQVKEEIK